MMIPRLLAALAACSILATPIPARAFALTLQTPAEITLGQGGVVISVGIDSSGDLTSLDLLLNVSHPGNTITFTIVELGSLLSGFTLDLVTPSGGSDSSTIAVSASSASGLPPSSGSGELLRFLFDVTSDPLAANSTVGFQVQGTLGFNLPDPFSTQDVNGPASNVLITGAAVRPLPEPGSLALLALTASLAAWSGQRVRRRARASRSRGRLRTVNSSGREQRRRFAGGLDPIQEMPLLPRVDHSGCIPGAMVWRAPPATFACTSSAIASLPIRFS